MTTYRDLGERLGIDVCTGCSLTHHDKGFWGADGRLHWAERAMRRTSIRNFVWRASAQWARLAATGGYPPNLTAWERYWRRVEWAKWALRELHVRLPAPAWDTERATLRALLAVPARDFFVSDSPEADQAARRAAVRWAKKPIEPYVSDDYDGG